MEVLVILAAILFILAGVLALTFIPTSPAQAKIFNAALGIGLILHGIVDILAAI